MQTFWLLCSHSTKLYLILLQMSAVLAERRKELKDRQQKELRQMEEEHNENLQRLQDEKQDDVKETFCLCYHKNHYGSPYTLKKSKYKWFDDHCHLNPCPAELFQLNFSSFKAGIANTTSSSWWRQIFIFFKNKLIWLTEHLPQTLLSISVT